MSLHKRTSVFLLSRLRFSARALYWIVFLPNPVKEKYIWTHHAREKLRYYRLTPARVKRIIRHPHRTEEAVVEGAVAAMQKADSKNHEEIWTLYILSGARRKQIKIISAWRYPGVSPRRNPIPADILRQIKSLV